MDDNIRKTCVCFGCVYVWMIWKAVSPPLVKGAPCGLNGEEKVSTSDGGGGGGGEGGGGVSPATKNMRVC